MRPRCPTQLFDTQVAAGFIGLGAPSLASLVERLLDVRLTKGDRLTDWTRRPLHVEQRLYAAADVEYLLELHDVLVARLEPMGRLDVGDRRVRRAAAARAHPPRPEVAWWRMKGARQLRGKSRGVAQQVGAWRERTAASLDVPPRFVLSDLALIGIVSRPPRNREELTAIRGVDGRVAARRRDRRAARCGRRRPRARPGDRWRCRSRTTSTARSRPRSR